jgi:hypothetical protein
MLWFFLSQDAIVRERLRDTPAQVGFGLTVRNRDLTAVMLGFNRERRTKILQRYLTGFARNGYGEIKRLL